MLSVDISNRSEFFVTGAAFHPATSFVAERLMQEQLYEVVMVHYSPVWCPHGVTIFLCHRISADTTQHSVVSSS